MKLSPTQMILNMFFYNYGEKNREKKNRIILNKLFLNQKTLQLPGSWQHLLFLNYIIKKLTSL